PPAPPWTIAWFSGVANKQQGHLDEAITNFRSALYDQTAERHKRKFDFTKDYVAHDELGQTLFERGKQERTDDRKAARDGYFREAVAEFEAALKLDAEDVMAHANLALLYKRLGDEPMAAEHRQLHERYKPDDNAQDRAINLARKKSQAANHAAESLVIYSLHRPGAPELPPAAAHDEPSGAPTGGGQ
ncbi:MAG TPA: hypothetical protein VGH74_09135, partial [Planctomycetaceae bacterium]